MTYLMFLFAVFASVGCGLCLPRSLSFGPHDGWFFFGALVLAVAAVFLWAMAIITPVTAGYDKRQCYRYGNLTSREVKYQRFSYWTWDCYVRTKSGNWISKDQVRGVDQ